MQHIGKITWVLLVIGGINWGLYGLLGMDLVAMLLGGIPILATIVYALIGLSGLYCAYQMITGKCNK